MGSQRFAGDSSLKSLNLTGSLHIGLTLLLFAGPALSEPGDALVKSNVSYKSVTELGFAKANEKLVYGDENPELQYGLLWLPKKPAVDGNAPLIVLIHGGCWLNAFDIRHSYPLSSALAEAGYGVWSLEYRRTGDEGGGWPGSHEDVRKGLAYTPMLKDYPVDLDQMVIMGHSAGGHLALLAAAENEDIDAVIGLAAITDIIEYSRGSNSCQTATIDFMGGVYEAIPASYQAANPASRPAHVKTLLLQGDIDTIVPFEQSELPGATPLVLEGAGHFDWVHPGTGAYQLLLSTLEDLFRK
jgi:acetyl esterase/lipase